MLGMNQKAMTEVAAIIAARDSIQPDDALEQVQDTLSEIDNMLASEPMADPEQYWQDELGLEPDYLIECLY